MAAWKIQRWIRSRWGSRRAWKQWNFMKSKRGNLLLVGTRLVMQQHKVPEVQRAFECLVFWKNCRRPRITRSQFDRALGAVVSLKGSYGNGVG